MASVLARVRDRYKSGLNIVGDLCIAVALVLGIFTVLDVNAPVDPSSPTTPTCLEYCYPRTAWFQLPGVVLGLVLATAGNLICAVTRFSGAAMTRLETWLFGAYLLYFIPLVVAFWYLLDANVEEDSGRRQDVAGAIVVTITGLHFVLGLVTSIGSSRAAESSDRLL
jgi:hypothetical protein